MEQTNLDPRTLEPSRRMTLAVINLGGWVGILTGLWIAGSWAWAAYIDRSYGVLVVALALTVPVTLFMMRFGVWAAVFVWRVSNLTVLAMFNVLERVLPARGQHHDRHGDESPQGSEAQTHDAPSDGRGAREETILVMS